MAASGSHQNDVFLHAPCKFLCFSAMGLVLVFLWLCMFLCLLVHIFLRHVLRYEFAAQEGPVDVVCPTFRLR